MPMFEYKCDTCGRSEDRWFATLAERDTHEAAGLRACKPNASPTNRKCPGKLKRQLSAPNFAVNGYSAANGYSNKGVV
jgi:predicted nucleic acid-binding Zn ribbon protein